MEFLITESQLKIILEQQNESRLSDAMKILHSFTTNLVDKVKTTYGINLKMLLMWGTSIGGMAMPLDNYIRNGNFTMTEDQKYLVIAGVIFILFFEGKRGMSKILETIKREKLDDEFEKVLDKATKLKNAFIGFLETIKATSSVFAETVAYSFIIPIINDLFELAHKTKDLKETSIIIAERLLSSGVVLIGREALISLIRKIIKKLK